MILQGLIGLIGSIINPNHSSAIIIGGARHSSLRIYTADNMDYSISYQVSRTDSTSGVYKPYYYYIALGKGTEPVKKTDYQLTDSYPAQVGVVNKDYSGKTIVTGTVTNGDSTEQSYTEIGLIVTSSDTKSPNFLLTRSLFNEPVVIPAGESKTFTITLDMNKLADSVAAS